MRISGVRHAAFTALAVLGLAAASAVPAAAAGHQAGHSTHRPTAAARHAGVTAAYGGYLGWRSGADDAADPALGEPGRAVPMTGSVSGIDVSAYQGNVDWAGYWSQGKRFAYVKATEGTYYRNSYFAQQYNGSYRHGFIRGSYHFANPSSSSGYAQANYFVAHGGGWSGDGKTLPGVLDIEYNPYGATCYGKSHAGMVSWIRSFVNRYKTLTGRDAVIYSTTDWWRTCTGNTTAFHTTNPLWIARYSSSPGTLPGGWGYYTFWQYSSSPVDKDYFNGSITRLKALANG